MAERYHNGAFESCAVKQYRVSKAVERTDTLPITINADGNALLDYRIYGAAEGVGDRTENLFDKNAKDTSKGYAESRAISLNGDIFSPSGSAYYAVSEYIAINAGESYTLIMNISSAMANMGYCFYDENFAFISGSSYEKANSKLTFTSPTRCTYMRFTIRKTYINSAMLVKGSTAPAEYVPYGYVMPISVSDGTTSITTPVCIGSEPLGEDEYVDYGEQKVYKLNPHNMLKNPALEVGDINYENGRDKSSTTRLRMVGYIDVMGNKTYCMSYKEPNIQFALRFYTKNDEYLGFSSQWLNNGSTFETLTRTSKIRCIFHFKNGSSISANDVSEIVLNEGLTPQPYLQPTDPPVPLPALPTVDGTNIVDYDGTPKPSQMYIKYNSHRGWEPCTEYVRRNGVWVQQTAPAQSQQSLSPQMSLDVQPIQSPSQTMGVDEPIALETDVTDNNGGGEI